MGEFSVLKAFVRPSQHLSNPPHYPWVAVKSMNGALHCSLHVHGWVGYISDFVIQVINSLHVSWVRHI